MPLILSVPPVVRAALTPRPLQARAGEAAR